jgi:transposase
MSIVEELLVAGEVLSPVVRSTLERMEARLVELERLEARLAEMERENAEMRSRLGMNSRNSSKPPSSDPPGTPRPKAKPTGKKRGAQPGHQGTGRRRVEPDEVVVHRPQACDGCGYDLREVKAEPRIRRKQVLDLPPRALVMSEHQMACVACPNCGAQTWGSLPAELEGHGFGVRLSALVSLLVGKCHLSRRDVEAVLKQMHPSAPSLGSVEAMLTESREALGPVYRQIRQAVRQSERVGVDESPWCRRGKRMWGWIATTPKASLFQISRSRSARVLSHLLGKRYRGILNSDRWSAYKRHPTELRQVCWAHLKRDFTELRERNHAKAARWGVHGVAICARLFHHWHAFKAGEISREQLAQKLVPARRRMAQLIQALLQSGQRIAGGMGKSLRSLEPALWTFVEHEDVEPTNNHAERGLRKLVIWRKICFGSDSAAGLKTAERLLSVLESCRLQQRNALDFLCDSLTAHRLGTPPPALFAGH